MTEGGRRHERTAGANLSLESEGIHEIKYDKIRHGTATKAVSEAATQLQAKG